VLHEAGFASQARAVSRDDGMRLTGLWISAVVHCAPPGNKPTPQEQRNCASWLDDEIGLLSKLRVVVCLGKIAFDGFLNHQLRAGKISSRAGFQFRHGAEYVLAERADLDCELSSIAAEHQHRQADQGHVSRRFQQGAGSCGPGLSEEAFFRERLFE